ncbi:MAG TPA: hydroxyacid dehydrogenase [Candidatus Limnocylindrales bacterium]|nr:hydroxyacid dehydrogenase [Candidatus Limnocylindrales bacterium]
MRILIASKIDPDAVATLQAGHDVDFAVGTPRDELEGRMADREALIFRSGLDIDRVLLDAAPRLHTIVRAGSGLDNLDLDEVRARGIHLQRIPGPGARAVAELTFALFLGLARQVVQVDGLLRTGHWAKNEVVGWNLAGKTLGIIGLGSIGSTVARLGQAWGMQVIGCVGDPTPERAARFATEGIELVAMEEVLRRGDFVSIHVPLDSATRGLIGSAELALMKRGSFLVNIARGGVVDEAALLAALTDGDRPAGAGLDVHVAEGPDRISPLAGLPNVVLTPHIGATTVDAQREIGIEIVRIIEDRARSTAERIETMTDTPAGAR